MKLLFISIFSMFLLISCSGEVINKEAIVIEKIETNVDKLIKGKYGRYLGTKVGDVRLYYDITSYNGKIYLLVLKGASFTRSFTYNIFSVSKEFWDSVKIKDKVIIREEKLILLE